MSTPAGAAALADFESDQSGAAASTLAGESGRDEDFDGENLLGPAPSLTLDAARVSALAERLAKLKGARRLRREYAQAPSNRLSLRHAVLGQPRWVRPEPEDGRQRVRRLVLVVDLSGSMRGEPLNAAAHLIAALSRCAKKGLLCGEVVLSTTGGRKGWTWMRRPLPWNDCDIERMTTHGGEGLAGTIADNAAVIDGADATYVVTDGYIGGPPIPHEEIARRGGRVTGLYCNVHGSFDPDTQREIMSVHFGRVILRTSVEALVDDLVSGRV